MLLQVLTPNVLVLATTRPNEPPVTGAHQHHLHGKAALMQKVAVMYRHLLKLPTTSCVRLEPFTFKQTEALMKVGRGGEAGEVMFKQTESHESGEGRGHRLGQAERSQKD